LSETYTITDLATEFRVTPRTIRFYEDKNLLHPERQGLNRVFGRRDRARLQLILRGKRLGFSLAAIREMLDLYDLGDGQVEQLRVTLKRSQERLVELEHQRRDINEAIKELKDGIEALQKALSAKGVTGHAA
jgi:DNA-binding transcriptional MerR regulator